MSPVERDDPARDPWLREALRHAPDADAAPSAALSAAILREARVAAAPARPSPWAAAWTWLARPPVAAGFASVMVATLIGLMWWDRPIDAGLQGPPAEAPAPAPAEAQRPAPPPAPGPAEPPPAAVQERAAAAQTRRAQPLPQGRVAAPPAARRDAADAAADRANAAPAPTPTAPEPAAAPATPRARTADAAVRGAAKAESAEALESRRRDGADERPPAWADLLASSAGQPERWRWQGPGGPQALTPALRDWLRQLDAQTATRWLRVAAAGPADGPTLRLERDGVPRATLRLDAAGASLETADPVPRVWRAELPAAAAAALRRALADATR